MIEERERYEHAIGLFDMPEPGLERLLRRRDRKRRNQRIAAVIVAIVVFAAPLWIVATSGRSRSTAPAGTGVTVPADHLIDLNTGAMTPLPSSIIRSLGNFRIRQYAASSDGSMLAYVGAGEEGTPQIFIAGIDGTGIRQVTHDPIGASQPAWSPDGSLIAYMGYGSVRNLFVVDLRTGASTQITHRTGDLGGPQFTPDGSSILYTGRGSVWTVPVTGGKRTLLIGAGEGVNDAFGGSMSPDGSLVTYGGSGWPTEVTFHCGPCSFVANTDGTERRIIHGSGSSPAGTWSPDGTRIVSYVLGINRGQRILVVDIATGHATRVAEGSGAIWIDDHTLLVEA